MKPKLKILHLEDDPGDAALVRSLLEAEGVDCVIARVRTRAEFVLALEQGGIDLILADFSLPSFDGMSALAVTRAGWPLLPFILVSGTLGEELAVDSLKSGATDYVLKDRLARLAPVVRRAMVEVEERSERVRLQARLIEAQKMEVVGQLAGGVAHDFNNVLAVIMGYTDLIAAGLGPESAMRNYVDAIGLASERAAGLTRQLLVFSRKQAVQPVVLDLRKAVDEMDKMLRQLIDENIEMTIEHGLDCGRIRADPGYLGQVLLNLVVNARDAMPSGGKLHVTTSNVELDGSDSQIDPGLPAGDYVMMTVRDTGAGMTEEVKAHLFEAFFTTKPPGKGTGLGLSTCQTIVQQSHGHIAFRSEQGNGTIFRVYFPRIWDALESAPKPSRKDEASRGSETVLVVEDEPMVRHLARDILETRGYKVLSASNGQEALQVASDHSGPPIRLVITDVIMPVMGGKVMAEWLKATYPDIKVLYTSGYMDDTILETGANEPAPAFLPKPYSSGVLALKGTSKNP